MPVNGALEANDVLVEAAHLGSDRGPVEGAYGSIGVLHEGIDEAIQVVMVPVEDIESPLQACVPRHEEREVVAVLDVVVAVEVLDELPAHACKARRPSMRIKLAVKERLSVLAHERKIVTEVEVHAEPEGDQPVEARVLLPGFTRIVLEEHTERFGKARPRFEVEVKMPGECDEDWSSM